LVKNFSFEDTIKQIFPFFESHNDSSILQTQNTSKKNSISKSTRQIPVLERDISERKKPKQSIEKAYSEQIIPTRRNTNMSEETIEGDRIFEEFYGKPNQESIQFRSLFPNKSEKKEKIGFISDDNMFSTSSYNQRISPVKIEANINSGGEAISGTQMVIEEERYHGKYCLIKILNFTSE